MSRQQKSRITHHASRFTHHAPRITFLAALLTLILLFFHKMAFSNLILARGDTFLYFYPYWHAAADALQNGRIPLWNPDIFMGSPLLANSQMGFFYPLNWPVWLLLETPYAVSASILLHVGIAGLGAYFAAQKTLGLGRWASLVTAVLFALGGYLTAQVEHINQLQGLAWLPWYLVVLGVGDWGLGRRGAGLKVGVATLAFALLFALQVLAGHTQTAFISGVTVVVWIAATWLAKFLSRHTPYAIRFTFHWKRLFKTAVPALIFSGLLALLLTAVQLLPTLELIQHSSREGGLTFNEVLSFSLNPLHFTRSLLPAYGQSLFTEYVAFLPITAVLLAVIGAWQWRRMPGVLPALCLVLLGLFLALGIYNPANWLVARLPGFNLFRVPARWLVIYGLGMALLAGVGWQIAEDRWLQRNRDWQELPDRTRENMVHIERPLRVGVFIVVGLMAWNVIANLLSFFIPTGPEAPFELVKGSTILIWLLELVLTYYLLSGERFVYNRDNRFRIGTKRDRLCDPKWLVLLLLLSLFFGSRSQQYNNLTTPEAYFDLRPPITRLQATTCNLQPATCHEPPERFLSLSDIFFDVGDQAEIDTIYQDQLPEAARYDYTVAIKNKEIIAPNLPMVLDLASVDGFDGGILPLQAYTALMQVILPDGTRTTDGRLRENLDAVPEAKWLDLFNTRYIITDKTGDAWHDGVFFDRQHPVTLNEAVSVGYVPQFNADGLWIFASTLPADVIVETAVSQLRLNPEPISDDLYAITFPEPIVPKAITMTGCVTDDPCTIDGLTLVNSTAETFQPLVLGAYRMIHSGDVKIYENLDALPRAFFVADWEWQPDVASSVTQLQDPNFDPRQTAVLVSDPNDNNLIAGGVSTETAVADVTQFTSEQIIIQTETTDPTMLILTEAYYPGWQATIDGDPTTIYQADGYFQAVFVPEGKHELSFTFQPESFRYGRILTLIGLGIALLLIIVLFISYRRKNV